MATIHQTIKLLKTWHYQSLTPYEKKFIKDVFDGIDGLGEVNDNEVKEYISDRQANMVRKIGQRFLIMKWTKV